MPALSIVAFLLAFVVASLGQAFVYVLGSAIGGPAPLWPFAVLGYTFRRYDAEPRTSAGTVLAGALIHFIVAFVLGVVFWLISPLLLRIMPLLWVWGLFYGALVFVVDVFFVLPRFNPTARRHLSDFLFLLSLLAYGALLGATITRFTG